MPFAPAPSNCSLRIPWYAFLVLLRVSSLPPVNTRSRLAAANRRGKASNISSRWRRQDFYGISTPPINMQTNLLEPGFALCGAALIQPVTMANHFQVAAAALPKVGPMPDRSESDLVPPRPSDRSFVKPLAIPPALKRLREIRRSRILSACIAALVIVSAVQYFSTVRQEEDIVDRESSLPPVATTPTRELSQALEMKVSPESVRPEPAPTVDSTAAMTSEVANAEDQAYQRFVRDIAERSLAHAEVMLKAVERRILISHDLTDTLDYGTAQLKKGLDHCTSTVPPAIYQEVQTKICHALSY